jgi:anion-transporting  ArsA/GET3 family ATPase
VTIPNGEKGETGGGIAAALARAEVVLVCGTGGVGKTTIAGVLAVEAARAGRRVALVTIDPARRLASALGLAGLDDAPEKMDPGAWDPDGGRADGGELWAMMLDPKRTFDRLVERHAGDPVQAQRILANGLYRSISGALGGTQEYMAVEQLHELHADGRFDLVVVDTPPSRRALEVLDAPARLVRMLDNRIFQLLVLPTRTTLRVAGIAAQAFIRTLSRVAGTELVDDAIAFFRAFDGMEEGFRARSAAVDALLRTEAAGFVLVTSPRPDAVEEAGHLAARLNDEHMRVAALVVNRIEPLDARVDVGRATDLAGELAATARLAKGSAQARREAAAQLAARFAGRQRLAVEEREALAPLLGLVGPAPVVWVPVLDREVVDFDGLAEVGRYLLGDGGRGAPPPGGRR